MPRSNVLSFPAPTTERAPLPVDAPPSRGVTMAPTVGYNAVELTYYDEERVPRIRIVLDTTVPQEVVQRAKRWMELTGSDLSRFPTPRDTPLLGPRLLRG